MTELAIEEEDIQMCLNCPLPECCNCLGCYRQANHVRRLIRVRELSAQGLSDTRIARALGVHDNTVRRLRRQLMIPKKSERGAV